MAKCSKLLMLSPGDFIAFLKSNNIGRFSFVYDRKSDKLVSSNTLLQELADDIFTLSADFMQHEGMFFQVSAQHNILHTAFIHKTNRGQASGGLRFWKYTDMLALLSDGMRLSKGMTRKNALANIWWGGGKGIMAVNPNIDINDKKIRQDIYQDYGKFISSLNGCYITAEDVGTNEEDMANIFSQTRFTTCIPSQFGGSGNPSSATALGVVCGMEAALDFVGMGDLSGKIIAIQGMGHVAEPMMGYLFERNVGKIIAVDIDAKLVEKVKQKYSDNNLVAQTVDIKDVSILFEDCDILVPCATGAILNAETIPKIKAKIICGAANNQLKDSIRDGNRLLDLNILYVPDFLINRMGIVQCADEQAGYVENDPLYNSHIDKSKHHSIYQTTQRVLAQSEDKKEAPADVAIQMADELAEHKHPIFGHRGEQIIQSLVINKWHED